MKIGASRIAVLLLILSGFDLGAPQSRNAKSGRDDLQQLIRHCHCQLWSVCRHLYSPSCPLLTRAGVMRGSGAVLGSWRAPLSVFPPDWRNVRIMYGTLSLREVVRNGFSYQRR